MITPEATPTFLETLPVARIFGVGDVTAARLKDLGITTGKDLKHLGLEHLQELFGKRGTVLYHFVRGEDDRSTIIRKPRPETPPRMVYGSR